MFDLIGPQTLADRLTEQVAMGRIPEAYDIPIAAPEGMTIDEATARLVAPSVAARLFPDRVFGPVLWVEQHEGHWHVYLTDCGPRR